LEEELEGRNNEIQTLKYVRRVIYNGKKENERVNSYHQHQREKITKAEKEIERLTPAKKNEGNQIDLDIDANVTLRKRNEELQSFKSKLENAVREFEAYRNEAEQTKYNGIDSMLSITMLMCGS